MLFTVVYWTALNFILWSVLLTTNDDINLNAHSKCQRKLPIGENPRLLFLFMTMGNLWCDIELPAVHIGVSVAHAGIVTLIKSRIGGTLRGLHRASDRRLVGRSTRISSAKRWIERLTKEFESQIVQFCTRVGPEVPVAVADDMFPFASSAFSSSSVLVCRRSSKLANKETYRKARRNRRLNSAPATHCHRWNFIPTFVSFIFPACVCVCVKDCLI